MVKKSKIAEYSLIYALVYTFCLYKNLSGITFPFFVAATFFFANVILKEFGIERKKDSRFLMISTMLIGISQFLTDNDFIHAANVIAVFALIVVYFNHCFFDDSKWSFDRYIGRMFLSFFGYIENIFSPLDDFNIYRKERKANSTEGKKFPWVTVLITVAVTFPIVAVITTVLADADIVFEHFVDKLLDWDVEIKSDFYLVPILTLIVFMVSYGMVTFYTRRKHEEAEKEIKKLDNAIVITGGIMFDLVYIAFSIIQIRYLFVGDLDIPAGWTYAEYAREGFFQLLFVSAFNLLLAIFSVTRFNTNKAAKFLVTVMSACTFIMIASSAFRMILYIRYYYFTFLRLLVLWALLVITLLMIGTVLMLYDDKFNLFKYSLVLCTVLYIALAFSHLDYWVARLNVSQSVNHSEFFLTEEDYSDNRMLIGLSRDAAPFLLNAENREKFADTLIYSDALYAKITPRSFNLSRYLARQYALNKIR